MKKLLLILLPGSLFLLLPPNYLLSQELGVRAGIMRSRANISRDLPWVSFESIDEFSVAIYFSFDLIGEQFGFQPEVNYTVKGFDAVEEDLGEAVSSKYKTHYIEIPLLLSYKLPLKGRVKPGVVFGPYFGFAQKVMEVQTAFGETEQRELDDNLKNMDFGLVFGANIRYRLETVNVIFDFRYNLGLSNISKDIMAVAYEYQEGDTIKNRAFALTFGLGFNLF